MALIDSSGFAHVRLTVTDIARSKAFYQNVFDWPIVVDRSEFAHEPGIRESPADIYGGVVFRTPAGALLGLRPVAPVGQRFDSEHTGLDHLSFVVDSLAELRAAAQRLSDADIEHGEINELTRSGIAILSFQDPDGINLELTAPLS